MLIAELSGRGPRFLSKETKTPNFPEVRFPPNSHKEAQISASGKGGRERRGRLCGARCVWAVTNESCACVPLVRANATCDRLLCCESGLRCVRVAVGN